MCINTGGSAAAISTTPDSTLVTSNTMPDVVDLTNRGVVVSGENIEQMMARMLVATAPTFVQMYNVTSTEELGAMHSMLWYATQEDYTDFPYEKGHIITMNMQDDTNGFFKMLSELMTHHADKYNTDVSRWPPMPPTSNNATAIIAGYKGPFAVGGDNSGGYKGPYAVGGDNCGGYKGPYAVGGDNCGLDCGRKYTKMDYVCWQCELGFCTPCTIQMNKHSNQKGLLSCPFCRAIACDKGFAHRVYCGLGGEDALQDIKLPITFSSIGAIRFKTRDMIDALGLNWDSCQTKEFNTNFREYYQPAIAHVIKELRRSRFA